MANQSSKTTTDHDTIQKWVESRSGHPATVKSTQEGGDPGLLRIDFEGGDDTDSLERIEWDAFFEAFEANKLAFLYQEELESGETSRFCKFVSR